MDIMDCVDDVSTCVNKHRDIWLHHAGIVPKMVAYSKHALNDATDEMLLQMNYFPVQWTNEIALHDASLENIKSIFDSRRHSIMLFHERVASYLTPTLLEYYTNTTSQSLVSMARCMQVPMYWRNCSEVDITQDDFDTVKAKQDTLPDSSSGRRIQWF